jgi:PST family polysaccharide transporter
VKKVISKYRKLIENAISLFFVQGINFIIPLLTIPYLVSSLGPKNYGIVIFSQTVVQYFVIVTDYGFNLSATKEISIHRKDREKVSTIFNNIIAIKLLLGTLCFGVLWLLRLFVDVINEYFLIFVFSYGMVVGSILFPIWLFQGLEEMKVVAFFNLVIKSLYAVLIFTFVSEKEDFFLVPIFNSLGFIVVGIFAYIYAIFKYSLKLSFINSGEVKTQLTEGWSIFVGIVSSSFSAYNAPFFLGLFYSPELVGYFASGEKVIRAITNGLRPVAQAIFPYINHQYKENPNLTLSFLRRTTILVGAFSLILSFCTFLYSKEIVLLLFGEKYLSSLPVIKSLAFLPFISSILHLYCTQSYIITGNKKLYSFFFILSLILNLLLCSLLIYKFDLIGAAVATMATEFFLVLIFLLYPQKKLSK